MIRVKEVTKVLALAYRKVEIDIEENQRLLRYFKEMIITSKLNVEERTEKDITLKAKLAEIKEVLDQQDDMWLQWVEDNVERYNKTRYDCKLMQREAA